LVERADHEAEPDGDADDAGKLLLDDAEEEPPTARITPSTLPRGLRARYGPRLLRTKGGP